jgi:hypothetical protein
MQELNRFGDLGWELVAVEPAQSYRVDRVEHGPAHFSFERAR